MLRAILRFVVIVLKSYCFLLLPLLLLLYYLQLLQVVWYWRKLQSKVNASRDTALCGLRVEIILLPTTTTTTIATMLLTITTSSMVLAQAAKQS